MSSLISRSILGRVPSSRSLAKASRQAWSDHSLLIMIVGLSLIGVIIIASASMAFAAEQYKRPFYFVFRQLSYLGVGLVAGVVLFQLPLSAWEKYGPHLIGVSIFLLLFVLFFGKEVNGSRRWINLGLFSVQVSETVKLFIIVYLAGYLVRRGEMVQNTFGGFIRPVALICIVSALLLMEPDFGAAVVIVVTAMAMLFVAGARLIQFVVLVVALGIAALLLVIFSGYRMLRVMGFLDPFSDPFSSGFQLTQSLIAIGSGGVSGSGLGNSVQKLFYLPEAHTDFVFAVLSEEFGFFGVLFIVILYSCIVWKCFRLARVADEQGNRFAGYVALGIGVWIGLQSFINMGVNMGMLPTKGITLPMLSYGGSSAVVFAVAFSLLLRVEWETRMFALREIRQARRSGEGRR